MDFDDYLKFKPIFYSEISSTFIVYETLKVDKVIENLIDIAYKKHYTGPSKIYREFRLGDAGCIDLLIECKVNNRASIILIEGKVHDYISTTSQQIERYYIAAEEMYPDKDLYFIYLTQFTSKTIRKINGLSIPPSIQEYEQATKKVKTHERLFHIPWSELHSILNKQKSLFSAELNHMLILQRNWMEAKTKEDIKERTIELGTRDIQSFLSDIDFSLPDKLTFGSKRISGMREVLEIDLTSISSNDIMILLDVFSRLACSKDLRQINKAVVSESTEQMKIMLIRNLIDNNMIKLVQFYSGIFSIIDDSTTIKLNGTGVRAFSVLGKTNVEISLCTMYVSKHTLEFGLLR